ncbi:MAG TPA: hypothetical protein VG713_07405 [Pirellulales bacterium]|nr:hypothetical protein [Pirellulales bacterium]
MPDSASLTAGSLRVLFERQGDRWSHSVEALDDDAWVTVLESVEGTPSDPWPPSPPLQQLHIESRDGHDVLLLLGMAGQSHWSLAVTAEREALVFDVACRCRAMPEQVGSAYHQPTTEPDVVVEVDSEAGSANCVEFPLQESMRIEANLTAVEPPTTVRWRYTISR